MKKLLIVLSIFTGLSYADVPTLNVQDLSYSPQGTTTNITQSELIAKSGININNADVRGAIINSGLYKVVDNSPTPNLSESSESNLLVLKPDYTLKGYVLTGSNFENIYDIPDSTNSTYSKTMSIDVEYKLINNKTGQITKSFTSSVSGREVQIFKTNQPHPEANQATIIANLSQDLGADVITKLKN